METNSIILTTEDQQLIQADLAFHYGIIPKKMKENVITLYIKESNYESVLPEEIELLLGMEVVLEPWGNDAINKALSQYYRTEGNKVSGTEFKLGNDFLENLIWEAKSNSSSDIHFEIFRDTARIRFRIDGKLIERYKVNIENYPELVNKIKIKSNLNISEKRLPQDGRINYSDFDIRVSILPTLHGEKIVMRILGKDTSDLSIELLGMSEEERNIYLQAVNSTKGIILISGPTGSGKTTTLYATLKLLNKMTTNILTIEDPIEYTMEGINQVQLKEEIGLTFASALKTFLRQDPDIIMLGEIRDEQTAQMAIRASLTGHLVLSTIHTNSAIGTLSRLMDMGIPPFLIAETLRISVAQRLVRKLCLHCKKLSHESSNTILGYEDLIEHYIPIGCNECYHTGYKGRIAIYELTPVDQKIIDLLKTGDSNISSTLNYERLSEKAFNLVKKGVTTLEEVYPILIEEKSNV